MLFCLLCVLVLLYLCSWKTRQNKTIYLLFFNKHFIFFFCFILFSILQQNPPSLLLKDQTQYNHTPFLCTMCTSFCTQMKTLFPTRDKKFASGHSWEDSLCAGHFLHLLALLICLKPSSTPQSLKLSPTLVENIIVKLFQVQ